MTRTPSDDLDIPRRDVLKTAVTASVAAVFPTAAQDLAAATTPNPAASLITTENAREGARDWQLTRVRLDFPTGYRSPAIEGYCSRQSVAIGEPLDICVSTNPPCRFSIEIFRMGFYAGRGARLMQTIGPLDGVTQPDPAVGERRLRACRWTPSVTLTIPEDWPSGVYLGRLSREPHDAVLDPWQSYVVFIVRDDRPADILFQCSDNTWQAYNRWPDRFSRSEYRCQLRPPLREVPADL